MLVVTDLDLGGAEAQVVALACGLAARGHAVEVVSMLPPEARTGELAAAGVPWSDLGMIRGRPDPRGALRLRRAIRSFRPDVVHAHMVHANLLARLTRAIVRMPLLLTTAHNLREGGRAIDLAYRVTDALSDLTTNVSAGATDAYVARGAAPRHRIRTVPNGLDLAPYEQAALRREAARRELGWHSFTWLAIGRLTPEKDFANLLAALVLYGRPEDRVVIAGSGPELRALEAAADERTVFLGRRTDIPDLMAAADAFVLPSRVEGLPMVLLEAAAARLPVVATDVGGNSEVIRDFESGRLVPSRDPAALAGAMTWLRTLPAEERAAIAGRAHQAVASTYSMGSVLDLWEQIYAGHL